MLSFCFSSWWWWWCCWYCCCCCCCYFCSCCFFTCQSNHRSGRGGGQLLHRGPRRGRDLRRRQEGRRTWRGWFFRRAGPDTWDSEVKSTSFINHTFSRTKKMFKSRAATVVAKTDVKMWKIDRWAKVILSQESKNRWYLCRLGTGRATQSDEVSGKRPLPPPLIFGKSYHNFSNVMLKKPCSGSKICDTNFWI